MSKHTLHGLALEFPEPYREGHRCSLAEAEALNRALARSLRVQLGKLLGETEPSERAELAARYIPAHCEGFAKGHERARAEREECVRIARRLARVRLNRAGGEASEEALEALSRELAASAPVRAEAARRVDDALRLAARAGEELFEEQEA